MRLVRGAYGGDGLSWLAAQCHIGQGQEKAVDSGTFKCRDVSGDTFSHMDKKWYIRYELYEYGIYRTDDTQCDIQCKLYKKQEYTCSHNTAYVLGSAAVHAILIKDQPEDGIKLFSGFCASI